MPPRGWQGLQLMGSAGRRLLKRQLTSGPPSLVFKAQRGSKCYVAGCHVTYGSAAEGGIVDHAAKTSMHGFDIQILGSSSKVRSCEASGPCRYCL
jgi:hypothetical protein